MFVKSEMGDVLQLLADLGGTTCRRTGVRNGERGSKKDPELSVERVDYWPIQNSDHLPVQVGIRPGETEGGNNLLHSLCKSKD